MNDPRVLIVGFGDALNYGGEAIVHGTIHMLLDIWPDARITIATDNLISAHKAFSTYNGVTIINAKKRFSAYRIAKGLLRRVGIGDGSPVRMKTSIVDGHDIVLSVGGDNFVQTPQKNISMLLEDLLAIGKRTKANGAFYCLWGASVGPFDDPQCFDKISRHLEMTDLIVVREQRAFDYLLKMGITGAVMTADPAFCMAPKGAERALKGSEDEILIGVNLSRLGLDYLSPSDSDEQNISVLADSVKRLLELDNRIRIVFIPHVMSSSGGAQDDCAFLEALERAVDCPTRTFSLPYGIGSPSTKSLMAQCDLVVAARMHCFVGSVSAGTPALMVAYSDKGHGMANFVYGHDRYVLGMNELNAESLVSKVGSMLSARKSLREFLQGQRSAWKEDAQKAAMALRAAYERSRQAC